jgi:hypothetical protein
LLMPNKRSLMELRAIRKKNNNDVQ